MLLQTESNDAPTIDRRPIAGGFPNLRCKEIVKTIVGDIVEACDHVRMSEAEQFAHALGTVKGVMLVARQDEDSITLRFVADVLDRLNKGGIAAIRRLVEVVNGTELAEPLSKVPVPVLHVPVPVRPLFDPNKSWGDGARPGYPN